TVAEGATSNGGSVEVSVAAKRQSGRRPKSVFPIKDINEGDFARCSRFEYSSCTSVSPLGSAVQSSLTALHRCDKLWNGRVVRASEVKELGKCLRTQRRGKRSKRCRPQRYGRHPAAEAQQLRESGERISKNKSRIHGVLLNGNLRRGQKSRR